MASCDLICIGEWIFLIFWFISVPIYCMVIYVIWKHRKTQFKQEFWLLTIALFVADLLHLCQNMWSHKMAAWGYLPPALMRAPKVVGWMALVPKIAFFNAQVMGVTFISINRYICIVKPLRYMLWTRKVTILCVCAQWCAVAFMLLSFGSFRFTLEPITDGNGSGFRAIVDQRDKKMAGIFLGTLMGIGGLLRVLFFIVLYGLMFHSIRKDRKVKPTVSQMVIQHIRQIAPKRAAAVRRQKQQIRGQFNLVVIGSVLALCDMAITIHLYVIVINAHLMDHKVAPEQMRLWLFRGLCFYDIYGWSNGWLLLIFCRAVREKFIKQYGWVKSTEVLR